MLQEVNLYEVSGGTQLKQVRAFPTPDLKAHLPQSTINTFIVLQF